MSEVEGLSPAGRSALTRAFDLGLLGPGSVVAHIRHALDYDAVWRLIGAPPRSRVADLGSGGGLPGLVLAEQWVDASFSLIDAAERRCLFLSESVAACGLGDRVSVIRGRAEELGHDGSLRGTYDLVVARSFGAPPVLAECAAPLLAVGGWLIVSEPPSLEATLRRWPTEGLALLGLGPVQPIELEHHFVAVQKISPTDDRYPRRVGIPAKRPLFPTVD